MGKLVLFRIEKYRWLLCANFIFLRFEIKFIRRAATRFVFLCTPESGFFGSVNDAFLRSFYSTFFPFIRFFFSNLLRNRSMVVNNDEEGKLTKHRLIYRRARIATG